MNLTLKIDNRNTMTGKRRTNKSILLEVKEKSVQMPK